MAKFKLVWDGDVIRFKPNRIIRDIMESINYKGLNEAHIGVANGKYTKAELRQFYRLTGTSISAYRDVFPNNKNARLACEDADKMYYLRYPERKPKDG